MTDYAHTRQATRNRAAKALSLANAATQHGFQRYELEVSGSTTADARRRALVQKTAGVKTASVETWKIALDHLTARGLEASGGVRCGRCAAPVRRVTTEAGAHLDIDPFASERGSVMPQIKNGKTIAVVLAGHDSPLDDTAPRFRQHATTCPASPQGKERRLKEAPKCPACGLAMNAELAFTHPDIYKTHPTC